MRRTMRVNKTLFTPLDLKSAQLNFLASMICDSVLVLRNRKAATLKEKADCRQFLQSKKCQRWLDFLDLDTDILNSVL